MLGLAREKGGQPEPGQIGDRIGKDFVCCVLSQPFPGFA
jgi:hypothetical protein